MNDAQPYHRQYPKDVSVEIAGMSLEERGVYLTIRTFGWCDGGIRDLEELARLCNVSPAKMRKLWERVCHRFTTSADGRIVHPALEAERERLQESHEERVSAGRKGARIRHGSAMAQPSEDSSSAIAQLPTEPSSDEGGADSSAIANGVANSSIAVCSLQLSEKSSLPNPAWTRDDTLKPLIEVFKEASANVMDDDWKELHAKLWKHYTFHQKLERVKAAQECLASGNWYDPAYIPRPRRFCETEWKRPIALPKPKSKPEPEPPKTREFVMPKGAAL